MTIRIITNLILVYETLLSVFSRFAFVSTGYGQENILLEEYMPKSIYKIPETKVEKAKYPVIDAHSHDYPSSLEEVAQWVKTMDRKGIEKTVVLTGYTGASFDSIVEVYAPYKDRFDLWCGLDLSDYGKSSFVKQPSRN